MTTIREAAYEIGRTTRFSEKDAMVAGALLAEDYPDQHTAVRVLDAVRILAETEGFSLSAMTIRLTDCLKGRVIS